MLNTFVRTIVGFSHRRPWLVFAAAVLATAVAVGGAAEFLTFNTDTRALFDRDLPFRIVERNFEIQFPGEYDLTVAVIDGPTAQHAQSAANRLAAALTPREDIFEFVRNPTGGPFFEKNGLLYLSVEDLDALAAELAVGQPLLGAIATDRNARGLLRLLDLAYTAAAEGEPATDAFAPAAIQSSEVIEKLLNGASASMDWAGLFAALTPPDQSARAMVVTKPVLDIAALQQGGAAAAAIRGAARELGITAENGYRLRLTGQIPLYDEEFVTVAEGTRFAGLVSVTLVTILLFLALGSGRIVAAAVVTLAVGLLLTIGWAAVSVGEINLISVAFAIIFIGLAVDFSIQFCMRYRAERYGGLDTPEGRGTALEKTGTIMAKPLLLAAAATALGFFSFLPTDYRGVSQLGVIAGGGMIIAVILSFTLLPALLALGRSRGEAAHIGYLWAAPFNRMIVARRRAVLSLAALAALVALAALPRLVFDFDPLKLKDPDTESMSTALELMDDPLVNPNTLNVLVENKSDVAPLAEQLSALPEVGYTVTVFDLIPENQDTKLTILDDLYLILGPALEPGMAEPPTTADIRAAAAQARDSTRAYLASPYAASNLETAAERLVPLLGRLASEADDGTLQSLSDALLAGFDEAFAPLKNGLEAARVTIDNLPRDLRDSFIARNGHYRVQIAPADLAPDIATLTRFVQSVRSVAPTTIGDPVIIYETGNLVTRAFASAAVFALLSIIILLFIVVRRLGDVLRVLAPLVLAATLTLGTCGALGFSLNFANIIALPLLLGVGVAYPIYFVTAWREGEATLLAAPAGRAMLFSALTTTAAFGSLALSAHVGTASMGILLTMAMAYTLIATLIVLPALLGAPPSKSV